MGVGGRGELPVCTEEKEPPHLPLCAEVGLSHITHGEIVLKSGAGQLRCRTRAAAFDLVWVSGQLHVTCFLRQRVDCPLQGLSVVVVLVIV